MNMAMLCMARLPGSDFTFASLNGIDGSELKIPRGRLTNTALQSSTLYRADLRGAHLAGADFRGSILCDADLSMDLEVGEDFVDVDIDGNEHYYWTATPTDLSGANLSWTNLSGARFSGANCESASFVSATLHHVDFGDCVEWVREERPDGVEDEIRHGSTCLRNADLSNSDLRFSSLEGANLDRANFSGARITGGAMIVDDLTRRGALGANATRL